MDRWLLNEGSEWITMALRAGDLGSAAHTLSERAAGLGLEDAVLGHANLYKVPWRTDFARPARTQVAILEGGDRTSIGKPVVRA